MFQIHLAHCHHAIQINHTNRIGAVPEHECCLTNSKRSAVLPFQIRHMSYHIGRKHLNSRRQCSCIKFHIRKFIYRKMQKYGRHISCKYTNCFILRRRRIFHFFFKTFPNLPYPFSGCHGSAKCQIRIYI